MKRKFFTVIGIIYICISTISVNAATDYMQLMEERKELPIQSNEIANWPEGPAIGAQAAILMEMNTHTILYSKNIDERLYPASTTKILTCLLAAQNCNLNDMVYFSRDAVNNVPLDGSSMGMNVGNSITLEQAMYGILVGSANEAASAVGEHVAKSLGMEANEKSFTSIMNNYAKSLGCKNSNFVNANGLYNDNHYTSAYDLALIGCEFFNNEILCKMSSTSKYHLAPTETQTNDIYLSTKNQLYKGKTYEYKYLLGSKTGYVSQARQTLVSGAEKDGLKLVCVVFMEESPYQYTDTVALFNYGFENFYKLNISDYETKYDISNDDVFNTDDDLFGDSSSLITMDHDAYIVLPKNLSFSDSTSDIEYSNNSDDYIASINYSYQNIPVGSCKIMFTNSIPQTITVSSFFLNDDEDLITDTSNVDNTRNVIFINIKKIIIYLIIIAFSLFLIILLLSILKSYNFTPRNTEDSKRRKKRLREKRIEKKRISRNLKEQRKLQKKKRKAYKQRNR